MRQERISPIGTAGDEDAVGKNSHDPPEDGRGSRHL